MPRLLILLFSVYGVWAFAQAPDIARGGFTSERDPGDAQLCRDLYEAAQCKEYFKKNPQNAKYAVNCDEAPPYEEGLKACGKGFFLDIPVSLWNSASARFSYYSNCAQS